jgi:hypothetical protein
MLAAYRATRADDFEDFDGVQRGHHQAKARAKWVEADDALENAVALASLVCGDTLRRSLVDLCLDMKQEALAAIGGQDVEPSAPAVMKKAYQVIDAVRRELRLEEEQQALETIRRVDH